MTRIAYFSPLTPIRSGISDYSEDLLPHLAELVEIDLFIDDFEPANRALVERFDIYSIADYPQRRWDYDIALYHMGNNLYHEAIYRTALHYPGLVVLHDFAIVGLLSAVTWGRGDREAFVREWGYHAGPEGITRARRIMSGHVKMAPNEPLNKRLLDVSFGVIVHSDYTRRRVLEVCPLAMVEHIPMLWVSHQPKELTRRTARRELGLGNGIYIGSFGFMTPSKGVEPLLDAFVDLLLEFPAAHLVFVGEPLDWYDPRPLIEARGLTDKVTITGYIPLSTWHTYMAAIDLAVNLRYPTQGETSASVLRLMGAGVPVIVSDLGWYAELPDECVVKLPISESVSADLKSAVTCLLSHPEKRACLSQRSRDYVRAHHAAPQVARRYVDFIEYILGCLGTDG